MQALPTTKPHAEEEGKARECPVCLEEVNVLVHAQLYSPVAWSSDYGSIKGSGYLPEAFLHHRLSLPCNEQKLKVWKGCNEIRSLGGG